MSESENCYDVFREPDLVPGWAVYCGWIPDVSDGAALSGDIEVVASCTTELDAYRIAKRLNDLTARLERAEGVEKNIGDRIEDAIRGFKFYTSDHEHMGLNDLIDLPPEHRKTVIDQMVDDVAGAALSPAPEKSPAASKQGGE